MSAQNRLHQLFTAALFTIVKKWKQTKHPLTDDWINKMWHIHIMECCLGIKRNEV